MGFALGELVRRFTEFLSRPQTCLITCGFSFSDEHLQLTTVCCGGLPRPFKRDTNFAQAFFASLTGVVMTFRNYPNRTKEEKRKHMHTLALLIMQDGLSIETPQTKGV